MLVVRALLIVATVEDRMSVTAESFELASTPPVIMLLSDDTDALALVVESAPSAADVLASDDSVDSTLHCSVLLRASGSASVRA